MRKTIIFIAGFSIVSTIINGGFTTTSAAYKWMFRNSSTYNHDLDQSLSFRILRLSTLYGFGMIDCGSTGLGNFRGGADLFNDILKIPHYSWLSIFLSAICAATGAFSNKVFNVDEGFEDFRSNRIRRLEALKKLLSEAPKKLSEEFPELAYAEQEAIELLNLERTSASDEDGDEEKGLSQTNSGRPLMELSFLKDLSDNSSDEEAESKNAIKPQALASATSLTPPPSPQSLLPSHFFNSTEYVSFFSTTLKSPLNKDNTTILGLPERSSSTSSLSNSR